MMQDRILFRQKNLSLFALKISQKINNTFELKNGNRVAQLTADFITDHLTFRWTSTSTWSWSWFPECWRILDSCLLSCRPDTFASTFDGVRQPWSQRVACREIPSRPWDDEADTWWALRSPPMMAQALAAGCSTHTSPWCFLRPTA